MELLAWPTGKTTAVCRGHTDCVLQVAWMSDSTLATASLDHDIAIWDADDGELIRRLKGHSRGVSSICFLPREQILVSGSLDQNIRVWRAETGELIRTLNNHTRTVHQLALRPNSLGHSMIASVSDDRTVRLWQPTIGRMVRFAHLTSTPLAVGWLNDGSRVVVIAADGHVRLIDPNTVEITHDFPAVDGLGIFPRRSSHRWQPAVGRRGRTTPPNHPHPFGSIGQFVIGSTVTLDGPVPAIEICEIALRSRRRNATARR